MAVMIPLVFMILFAVSRIVSLPGLYQAFGFETPAGLFPHMRFIGLFLLATVFSGYSDIAGCIGNWFSRRDEFEADRYSATLCGSSDPLVGALIKLNSKNLSEITPPKIYCIFNYSHPPLLERIRALGYGGRKNG
jgi:STE24 endopeptidase